jgi:hypothetical protein
VRPIFSFKISPNEVLGRIDFRSDLLKPKNLHPRHELYG